MPDDDDQNTDYQDQVEAQAGAQYRQVEAPTYAAPPTVDELIEQARQKYASGQAQQPEPQVPEYDPSKASDDAYGGAAPAEGHSGLRAFGDEVWASTLGMGQGVLGAVSAATRALTSNPDIVAHIENAKAAMGDHIQRTMDSLSDEDQAAMRSSFFGGKDANGQDTPVPGKDVSWGDYIKATAASLVPQIALAVVPGGIVGKAVTKLAGAALSEGGAALAGTVASRATTAAGFGAMDAGDAYNTLVDEIDHATPAQLNKSPIYQELRNQGASDIDARKGMVAQIAPAFAAQRFAVGAVAGAGLGEGLAAGIPGAAERGALARFGIGAAEGAGVMGGQGAADTALQQGSEQQAGLRQGYDAGAITQAGVSGALAGALMGGAAGLVRTRGAPQAIPDAEVEPAAKAALASALPQQQTELFSEQQLRQPPNVGAQIPPGPNAQPGQGEIFAPRAASPVTTSTEPNADIQAQLSAVSDPASAKNTMFVAKGTPMPDGIPKNVLVAQRPEGTLLTTDPAKLQAFREGPLTNDKMAALLDYPQSKNAVDPGTAKAVQAKDAQGNTVTAAAVDPAQVPAAAQALAAHAPGGSVEVAPVAQAVGERAQAVLAEKTPVTRADYIKAIRTIEQTHGYKRTPAIAAMKLSDLKNVHDKLTEQTTRKAPTTVVDDQPTASVALHPVPASPPQAVAERPANAPGASRGGDAQAASSAALPPAKPDEAGIKERLLGYAEKHGRKLSPKEAEDYARMIASADDTRVAMRDATMMIANGEAQNTIDALPAEPTEAQAKAGNYQKSHVKIGGLDVAIETAKGQIRRGTGADGKPWSVEMPADYGYIKRTEGADGDHVDVYVKPGADATSKPVFVVDQINPHAHNMFDEHKAMLGFDTKEEALAAYHAGFSDGSGPKRVGAVSEIPFDQFKEWSKGDTTKQAMAYKASPGDQIRAKMAAKRAAEKARMAETGPAQKGAAFVADGDAPLPKENMPGKVRKSRTQARAELKKALTDKDLTPRKGVPVSQVMRQALKEIDDLIDGKDNTEQAVHDAIEKWGSSDGSAMIPGSTTRRGDLAALLSKRMLGDDYKPKSRLAAEAAREVGAQQTYETETHARAARIEDDNAEAPAGERAADELHESEEGEGEEGEITPVSARVENAGNRAHQASELLTQVEQGLKTVQEAHAEYGQQQSGAGRRRKFATFTDYLKHTADAAEEPGRQNELVKKLARLATIKDPVQKAGATKEINLEMRRTGAEYANSLRKMALDLEDPVGQAARAQDRNAMRERMQDRIRKARANNDVLPLQDAVVRARSASYRDYLENLIASKHKGNFLTEAQFKQSSARPSQNRIVDQRAGSSYVSAARDPALNKFVSDQIERAEKTGVRYTLHQALDSIANNPGVANSMRPLQALAQRLRAIAPDIEVMSPTEAERRGLLDYDQSAGYYGANESTGGLVGHYNPGYNSLGDDAPRHIVIAHNQPAHVETLIHEALHSVTEAHISRLLETNPDHPSIQALHAIQIEIENHLNDDTSLTKRQRNELEYALTNEHETHTMLMSNPTIQDWAARQVASPELRAELARLGYMPGAPGRSVWRHFTDWVRQTVGLPRVASASEQSLLDHMMRPLTDITDQASRYNRALELYPDIIKRGEPMMRVLPGTLGERAQTMREEVGRAIDIPSLPDKLRTAGLAAMPTDALVDRYGALFKHADYGNPLVDFRAANERQAAASREFRDRRDGVVHALLSRLTGDPANKLGALMRDATLHEAVLGNDDPDVNAHVEDQAALADLQRRFSKLSDTDQETYIKARNHYSSVEKEKREAMFSAVIARTFPDIDAAQRAKLASIARTRKGIDAFLKNPDDLATMFGTAWETQRGLVRNIMKIQRLGFVQGDYFPLRRFGDYVLRYGSPENDDYGVEMFEKRGDAEARQAELVKQGVDALSDVMIKRRSNLTDILPSNPAVDELHQAMASRAELADHADSVRDLLHSVLLEHATRSHAARMALRRNHVVGASDDAGRVLAREFLSAANAIGALKAGPDRQEALARMSDVARSLERNRTDGSGIIARQVLNEVQQRTGTGDDAAGAASGLLRRATGLGFVQSLMSPSHMLTSSIEAHMNSAALLGARHGLGRASAALTKALADVSPTMFKEGAANTVKAMTKGLRSADWNLSHVARDKLIARGANAVHMTALFKALDDAGLVDHSAERELRRIANPGGYAGTGMGKSWQRFMDFNAAGAHAVDVANKSAVAKAAFDLEFAKTRDVAKSVQAATDMVRRVVPNYNLSNKARISTDKGFLGPFAAPLTQFKQYGLHMYSLMANLARSSMHGATPAERTEARRAFAGILAGHALMAGGLTLVADPLRYIGGAYDMVTGSQRPHDYENDVRGFLAENFGPELGEILSRGLPHLAGIDIHNRVGLANLLEVPEMDEFTGKGALLALGKLMTGASGEDAANMVGGMSKLGQGDLMGGLTSLVPRVVRDAMKASNLAQKGLTDSRGNTVLAPSQIGLGGIAAQAVGFQPAAVSEAREGRAAVQEAKFEGDAQRAKLAQAWLAAEPADRPAIAAQIRMFNNAGRAPPLLMDQLYRELAAKQQARKQPSVFGVRLGQHSASIGQAGNFANP